jgi:serine/threonine protein phosphatase PrpC
MNVNAGAKTDKGQRPNNEDQFAVVDTRKRGMRADGVLIIADGMGGRNFGEQAAAAAVETVEESLAEMLDVREGGAVVMADALASALRKANARVYELSSADEDRKGMGTTCVAAVIEGERLYVAHAGDSRAYLLREGALRQLTADHSYVAEQVRAGAISEEGARKSRFRNIITRAVGIEPTLEAEVAEAEVQPGDTVLLCTDGLSNMVEEDDIARTLAQSASPQAAADKLVQMANRNGGKDNITAVVARLQAGTRTLRMQVADLVRPDAPAGPEDGYGNGAHPAAVPARARRSALWPTLALLFLALGAGASGWLAHRMARDGYTFIAAPPFAVKPVPPPPPRPPDPAHVAYDAPTARKPFFYYNPVRGNFLAVSPQDGLVTVATLAGTVVALNPADGQVRYKYSLPFLKPQAPAPAGALGANGVTVHTATDPQGNLYVSDAVAKTVTKYRPNGEALGLVAHSALKNPQAIAAAADGTIYLIDAERLKVFHAHPSTTPLPPIPKPAPKPVAPVAPALPAVPPADAAPAPPAYSGRHFRHYGAGYRHYGYRRYSGGQR